MWWREIDWNGDGEMCMYDKHDMAKVDGGGSSYSYVR